MNSTPRRCWGRLNNKRLQLINHLTTCSTGFASTFPALLARSPRRNEGRRAMEPYWNYEDIGIYFFVLVLLGAVIRISVRIRWLDSSALVTPSLALQTSVIVFLGLALYLI